MELTLTDQKHRNRYKRLWRNSRNLNETIEEMHRLRNRAHRSFELLKKDMV